MKLERLEEMFFAIWCLVMPVTSVLLVPSIQGTVPAYMMAFASIVFVSMRSFADRATLMRYLGSAVLIALLWTVLLCGSQLGHLLSSRVDFGGMYMIDMDSPQVLFRPTIFTQTLYLAACSMIALYFRFFFREEWMKYIAWGAWLLAIYAIYEWSYYLVFQTPGDFLVNRTFNDGAHSGSWSQGISVGPFSLLRVKSTLESGVLFRGSPSLSIVCDRYGQAVAVHRALRGIDPVDIDLCVPGLAWPRS